MHVHCRTGNIPKRICQIVAFWGLIVCSAQSSAKSETVLPSAPRIMPEHSPSWAVWVAIHSVLRPMANTEWSSAVLTVPESAFDGMCSPLHAYAVSAEAASCRCASSCSLQGGLKLIVRDAPIDTKR